MTGAGTETPCPECGEMVRVGMVRCWNCGAFMNPELEEKFMAMQADPAPVIYSDPEAAESGTFQLADDAAEQINDFELRTGTDDGDILGGLNVPAEQPSEPESVAAPAESAPPAEAPAAEPEDDVLAAAMSDLKETQRRTEARLRDGFVGGVKTAGGFIVFCPYGCKIEVKEKHRGQMGKCPKCLAPFFVPVDPPDFVTPQAATATGDEANATASTSLGSYALWLEGMRVHPVDPEKLKLKADSLAKDFAPFELAVSPDHVALIPLQGPKGGLFGGGPKVDELRAKAKEAAKAGPLGDKFEEHDVLKLDADLLRQCKVVQPTKQRGDSMFAGVPVFGQGRIAVQLPDLPGRDKLDVISFTITEFRKFSHALSDHFGIGNFGEDVGVPLENEHFEHSCHYTDGKIRALDKLDFYKADPAVELILAGWQCAACGMTLSEDARKKENLGGKGGKGIAKVKCPKCSEKMGDQPLYTRAELVEDVKMQSET